MKKIYKLITLILIILLINILLNGLIKLDFFKDYNYLILTIIIKLFLTIIIVFLISKRNIIKNKISLNIKSTLFSILFIILSLYFMSKILQGSSISLKSTKHIVFFIYTFSIGLFEELFFRVFIFYSILSILNNKLVKTIIISSAIFALAHFSNLLDPEIDNLSIINQVISAFGIGLFFQSLLIKYKNPIIIVVLHSMFNYFGIYKVKLLNIEQNINLSDYNQTFIFSLIMAILFSIIIIRISFLFIMPKQIE